MRKWVFTALASSLNRRRHRTDAIWAGRGHARLGTGFRGRRFTARTDLELQIGFWIKYNKYIGDVTYINRSSSRVILATVPVRP